jgi:hypothetical protein
LTEKLFLNSLDFYCRISTPPNFGGFNLGFITMVTKAKKEPAQDAPKSAPKSAPKMKITPVKKLTVKAICGPVLVKNIPEGEELLLCRIAGTANGTEQGESTYGVWHALTGTFAATNYETGEIFTGKAAFVPGAMGEALISALEDALKEDVSSTIKFSVDVSVVVSARDANKHEYIVRPVIESDVGNAAVALLGLSE